MSQLHERLEQLVHYSSQLIFVSGDSASLQQRTLSDFLASQGETTEVSFFAASEEQNNSDYRRIICRQLASHTVGSFVRPLSDLLADLDPDKGPYLVCISNAHLMDMDFLNELWEWVTNSRAHNDRLHVNVIVFASAQWTENAQKWLPDHHTNKPVLLSSQSIDPVGFDVTALESLMAQKRAFFANESRYSIVRKKWFIASILGVFFLIFAALMALQYPQHVKSILISGELEDRAKTADSTQGAPEPVDAIVDTQTDNSSNLANDETSSLYSSPLEVVEPEPTNTIFASDWMQSAATENESPAEPTAQATVDENSEYEPSAQVESEEQLQENIQEIAQSENQETVQQSENAQDFAVDDITSVQDLDEQLEQTIREQNQGFVQNQGSSDSEFTFDEALLLDLPAAQISIQLSGIQNRSVLDQYINDNNLSEQVWIYQTQRYGGPWYVVLYAQTYASMPQASEAIANLPANIRSTGPFAKSLGQIQTEILQN